MNSQYVNQPPGPYGQVGGPPQQQTHGGFPPQGYGPPPGQNIPPHMQGGMAPPAPGVYNGPNTGPAQRPVMPPGPPGPPGAYGPPQMKASQPPVSMTNGPGSGPLPGPQGDQQLGTRGPAPPQFPGPPGPGQGPLRGPSQPPVPMGQLSNQMGAMGMGPPGPSRPGMPPSGIQPGVPPPGPPSSMAGMPPHSMAGMPPRPGMHPGPTPGPPSMAGTPMPGPPMPGPPASMSGPPSSMPGPPSSMPGPPSSMPGPPGSVTSMPGPPSSGYGAPHPGMPPSSMQQGPPTMGVPPSSLGGPSPMGAPPISMGPPATSMPGPPSGPPGPGMMPTSMQGPPQMGVQPGMQPQPINTQAGMPNAVPQGMGQQQPYGMPGQPPPSPGGQYPGYSGAPQNFGGMGPQRPQSGPGQPQQPRRLDPDQMPSPIQVIEDDRRNRSGLFQTAQRGGVAPLVTTDFIAEDQGNASPRFIRSTMYNIPCTADMLKQTHIPFALNITPFARLHPKENPPPIIDLGQLGPVRCNRCKAYMSPYMQFIDGGRRFQCCFCSCSTEVPPEYFNHLDHTGRRVDCYDRPELCLGTYEFVATQDYCRNNVLPKPPAFIFMIDVSYNSVKSGLVHLLCGRLKEEILPNLPKEAGAEESEIRVGFVTYAKEIHFYNVKGALAQPQMLVVSDVQDVFVPLLDGFLVKLSESEAVIDSLLEQIPQMFAESRETEIVLGPVIQAGLDAIKSAECAGKLFIFHSSLPIAEAPGKLKNRDDRKLLGTDKEKTLLTPAGNFYTKLGQECVTAGCAVDLFLFPNSYLDIATISEVPRLTGGQVYKYTYFQADLDGQRLLEDLKINIQRPIAFDGIMRIRTSTGIRPVDFLGNFYMSNTTDVELATIDCDKSVTIEIKHDDKLADGEGAYIQAAILYTSVGGQRRLRVLNMAFNCCMQMADLFRNCELDAIVNHMAKLAIRDSLNHNPKHLREHIMNQCAQILACYRKNCASPSSAGQLILPECMKLLPVYSNCVIKSPVLQGGSEIMTDDRSWLISLVNAMPVRDSCVFFYPRLIPLHSLEEESNEILPAIRCSYERLQENGVYLLENGLTMYMWIGLSVDPHWVQSMFGVQSAAQIDIDKTQLQDLDNAVSRQVRAVVKRIREERNRHMKLIIVRQRDKLEPVFQQYLMEDRGSNGTASYVDFLCHIHKEIRNLMS